MAAPSEPSPRIEDYGLIGDMHTCALVGKNGSIDFLCWPTIDSPSIFARILDTTKGSTGYWSIKPQPPSNSYVCKQNYRSSTNILVTKFIHEDGVVDLTDFFAVSTGQNNLPKQGGDRILVRKTECLRGSMAIDIDIEPRSNYASPKSSSINFACSGGPLVNDTYQQRLSFASASADNDNIPGVLNPWFHIFFCCGAGPRMADDVTSPWIMNAGRAHATVKLIEGQRMYILMREEDIPDQRLTKFDSNQQVFDLEKQVSNSLPDPQHSALSSCSSMSGPPLR